jgi:hypothetical protein
MAKQPQDDTSENKQSTTGREPFSVREGQFGNRDQGREQFGRDSNAASREAQSAARHAQQAVAELTAATMMQPYAELMQEIEAFNRDWASRMRSSVERTLDLSLKLNETFLSQVKRTSDLYLRLYETDISASSAMTRDLQDRASSAARRFGSQAAE